MRVLALDTTTRAGSVAIVEDSVLLVERAGDPLRSHAERLPQDVLDALVAAGLTLTDIDLFAVASGPGSFTGLRIGIATIQALALVNRRHVVPVSALRALAATATPGLPAGARVAAWMDAHRRDVFTALYEVSPILETAAPALVEVEQPSVEPPAAVLQRWARAGLGPQVVCGDGAVLYAPLLPGGTIPAAPAPIAGAIARLALAAPGEAVAPAALQPLYVRRPDAEIARDAPRTV